MSKEKDQPRAWLSRILPWTAQAPKEKALLRWEALEFYFVDKSVVWGVIASLIFIALIGFFIYFGQILVAVLTAIFLAVILKLAYAKPEKLEYRLDHDGLRVAGWLHPYYKEIVGFWTGKQGRLPVVYFKTNSLWSEHFAVPLGDMSPKKIAKVLANYIPELTFSASVPKTVGRKA
jgi:hypothetical protein